MIATTARQISASNLKHQKSVSKPSVPASTFRAANTTQKTEGLRLRRGVKPQEVHAYNKAKQRCIKGGIGRSYSKIKSLASGLSVRGTSPTISSNDDSIVWHKLPSAKSLAAVPNGCSSSAPSASSAKKV